MDRGHLASVRAVSGGDCRAQRQGGRVFAVELGGTAPGQRLLVAPARSHVVHPPDADRARRRGPRPAPRLAACAADWWRSPGLAAAVSFVIVVGYGNFWHEYYQLPVIPPAALLFGLAVAPVFGARVKDDGVEGDRRPGVWQDWLDGIAKPLIVVGLAILSFYFSGIIRNFFRPDTVDFLSVEAGPAMGNHIPPGDGVIVVEYEQGTNSPVLLYFLRHRGWSFDMKTITPAVIEYLKTQGATHFATTDFLLLEDKRPDVVEYLRRAREIPLGEKIPPEARLFELH